MEYSPSFAENLMYAADALYSRGVKKSDDVRAIDYLCLLACEIAIKSALENAGMPTYKVRKCGHNHVKLLRLVVTRCEERHAQSGYWRPASSILTPSASEKYPTWTVGHVFDQRRKLKATEFPGTRYGNSFKDIEPEVALGVSKALIAWVRAREGALRLKLIP